MKKLPSNCVRHFCWKFQRAQWWWSDWFLCWTFYNYHNFFFPYTVDLIQSCAFFSIQRLKTEGNTDERHTNFQFYGLALGQLVSWSIARESRFVRQAFKAFFEAFCNCYENGSTYARKSMTLCEMSLNIVNNQRLCSDEILERRNSTERATWFILLTSFDSALRGLRGVNLPTSAKDAITYHSPLHFIVCSCAEDLTCSLLLGQ